MKEISAKMPLNITINIKYIHRLAITITNMIFTILSHSKEGLFKI